MEVLHGRTVGQVQFDQLVVPGVEGAQAGTAVHIQFGQAGIVLAVQLPQIRQAAEVQTGQAGIVGDIQLLQVGEVPNACEVADPLAAQVQGGDGLDLIFGQTAVLVAVHAAGQPVPEGLIREVGLIQGDAPGV